MNVITSIYRVIDPTAWCTLLFFVGTAAGTTGTVSGGGTVAGGGYVID